MPGFQTTVIGLQEARLVALQTYLQSKVADLNTTLQLAPLSMPTGTAASANIIIGDPYTLDESLAFTVCVTGGGGRAGQGLELDSEFKEIGLPSVSAIKYGLHSRILVYIHPDAFPVGTQSNANVYLQTANRHRLLCRICDWLRADCFAVVAGVNMTLTSEEYTVGGDNLTMQKITAINFGDYDKGFGNSIRCEGAEILLSAVAQ